MITVKGSLRKLKCAIGDHDWTCAIEQGIKPTLEQKQTGVYGFIDYATMYCKHCGTVANITNRMRIAAGLPKMTKVDVVK